jgi:hypothetical protein
MTNQVTYEFFLSCFFGYRTSGFDFKKQIRINEMVSPKKEVHTNCMHSKYCNFVVRCIQHNNTLGYTANTLSMILVTEINLWTLMDQLILDLSLSMGYHGQQMWISWQPVKSTKIQNPNPVVNLLKEMEKIWTSYFCSDSFNFPSNFPM